jgi:cytochrome c553
MRQALVTALMAAGLASPALAETPPPFAWTQERFDLVAAADSTAGKELAEKYRCAKCHNDTGVSDDPEIPTIAGQRATYMYKQLVDYKTEVRENRDMYKVARKLSDEEMIDISAWYEQQERPPKIGKDAPLVAKVCDSCHDKAKVEEDGYVEVAPILAGQIRPYLLATMLDFKQADRSNDLFDRMQSVTHKLTDNEIAVLAHYYGAAPLPE